MPIDENCFINIKLYRVPYIKIYLSPPWRQDLTQGQFHVGTLSGMAKIVQLSDPLEEGAGRVSHNGVLVNISFGRPITAEH